MGAAEVISCEEVRASKQWNSLRQQLHERFDPWLDTLAQQWHEPPSTLREVTTTVWDLRQQLTGGLTETIVAQVHRGEHDRTRSPVHGVMGCCEPESASAVPSQPWGGRCSLRAPMSLAALVARVAKPRDDTLGLVAGCTQLEMQHAAAQLVTEVPYDTAQSLCGDLRG